MGIDAGVAMSCAGLFYKPVSETLGVTVGEVGLYMGINFLASTLMLSVAGRMMERWGARLMLSLSSGLLGACLICLGFATALWQFYAAGAFIGVSLAFLYYLSFPTLINSWFRKRVGLYIGICSAFLGVGGALLSPVCVRLIESWGWRSAYLMLGGSILLIITPLLALLLRNAPAGAELPTHATNATRPAEQAPGLRRCPIFYALLIFAFLINATAPLCLVMPSYVTELSGAEQAGYVASAIMFGVALGKIALGIINDKSPTAGVMVATLCGIAGLLALSYGPLWGFVPGGFLFGWAFAGVSVQTPLLTRAIFGSRGYGLIYARVSIALAAGGTLAAGGWGLLAERSSYSFIFTLGAVFLLICLIIGTLGSRKASAD